ncbi:MAG: MFS transporter [Paludibacteraceae bacterium]|nr:MFS transporter [Paludibacteraceae bacterium]
MTVSKTKRHAREALLSQYFFMGFIFATLFSRFPSVQEHYGLSISELSTIPFCMSIGSLLMMPFCGYLAGKFGSKKLSAMGYVYMSLFALLMLLPTNALIYPFCMLYGVFVSLTDIAINANSIIVEKAYKRPIIGLFHALFYVGVGAGAILSIICLTLNVNVAAHFMMVSAISLIQFYIVRTYFLKETPSKKNVPQGFKLLLPKGVLLLIAFIALCGRIIEGSVSDWSTVYMKEIVSLEENIAPVGLLIYASFIAFGRFFGDSIRKRFSEPTILLGCSFLAMLGLGVMIMKTDIYFAVTGLFISGLGLSCLVPIIYSLAGNRKDVSPGTGIAMVNTISGTGFLFGPFVIGMIAEKYNMHVSFIYIFVLSAILFTLSCVLWKKGK